MNAQSTTAYGTYGRQQVKSLSGRAAEAHAFATAARMLNEARQAPENRRAAIEALRYNLNLWTGIQASLGDAENGLPDGLTADLLALSVFVDKRTAEAIAHPTPALLDALIDIDRAIAQGQMTQV